MIVGFMLSLRLREGSVGGGVTVDIYPTQGLLPFFHMNHIN